MSWRLGELARAAGGKLAGPSDLEVTSVSTDTRSLGPGALFVAVKGESFDGHDFVSEARKRGAAAVLMSRAPEDALPAIVVTDTVLALGALARAQRASFPGPVVAITGSNGKTTTKELCARVLEAAGRRVRRTPGNLNNHIGLPLSILGLEAGDEVLVVELGMNHAGEIDALTRIADPTVGAITNVAPAHLGMLGSLEAIADAKGELFARMRRDATAIVNADDPNCVTQSARFAGPKLRFAIHAGAEFRARLERIEHGAAQYTLTCPAGEATVRMRAPGLHLVDDGLCAAAAAFATGLLGANPLAAIVKGLEEFSGVPGRVALVRAPNGMLVIDDSYNANPHSVARALETLTELRGSGRAFAVLGDMFELGDDAAALHAEVGRRAAAAGVDTLVCVGELSANTAAAARAAGLTQVFETADPEQAVARVRADARSGDVVLVKASRGMKLERVVKLLTETC
ncbi:MAG TPA: UDP-N-acetylmuramoyl-tripeptide--D-alanyl-D-alanine ligase [Myxococcota bacterium]|nr:UDP-N-acetylmuramoyl-tripeptide--D-alanyl-D-alanine ligase [Myxococcota bacterium]